MVFPNSTVLSYSSLGKLSTLPLTYDPPSSKISCQPPARKSPDSKGKGSHPDREMAATSDADVSPPLEPLTAAVAMPAGSVSDGPAGPTAKRYRFGEDAMQTPLDVEQMRMLHGLGWSQRAIARELGCCPRTVCRYLRQGGWKPYEQRPVEWCNSEGAVPA
jgi:hypothetical protein